MAESTKKTTTKKRYIINETVVDRFSIVRKRIELTPGICDVCGFDLCERNNLPPYDELNAKEQAVVKEGIDEHKAVRHSVSSAGVIDEEDMPEQWLGEKYERERSLRRK